jgi:glutaconyl-CoA/methylmalonyl-CoA decarboxylase subunit gamma
MKSYKISVNGQSYDVTVEETGASYAPAAAPAPRAAAPAVAAAPVATAPAPAAPAPARSGGGVGSVHVKSPMPGTLLSYKVAEGETVAAGQVLLILEAMKMENEIVAPAAGKVVALCAGEGASVNTGDVLVEIG